MPKPITKEYLCEICGKYHTGRPLEPKAVNHFSKRTWQDNIVGQIFEGRQGRYTVESQTKDKISVRYISGEWKDKEVTMSYETHNRIQMNLEVGRKVSQEEEEYEINSKLDLWWYKYPALYNSLWKEGTSGKKLLEELEETYSTPAQIVEEIYNG